MLDFYFHTWSIFGRLKPLLKVHDEKIAINFI